MANVLGSPWIPAAALIVLASIARLLARNWLAPSAFSLGVWVLYIVVPLAIAPEYEVSGEAVWILLLLIGSLALGAVLTEEKTVREQTTSVGEVSLRRLLLLTLCFSLIALIGSVYYLRQQLKEYGLDSSSGGLLLVGRMVYISHDEGVMQAPPWLIRAAVIWVFPAALLGGIGYALATSRRQKLVCFIPMAPALVVSLLNATRANALITAAIGCGGFLAMRVHLRQLMATSKMRKLWLKVGSSVAIALLFFVAVDSLREHKKEDVGMVVETSWPRIKSTAVGYLACFDYWITHKKNLPNESLFPGAYTFGGLWEVLGIQQRKSGVFRDFVNLGESESNNLYTAFRGMIDDFTLPGAVVVLFLFGLSMGYAQSQVVRGKFSWVFYLAIGYSFVIWSPIISVFNYNGGIVAAVVGILSVHPRFPDRSIRQAIVGMNVSQSTSLNET